MLGGIVIWALLASAMATANAPLISLAGCFSRDFYNMALDPKAELDDLPSATLYARVAVGVSLVLGVLVALRARAVLVCVLILLHGSSRPLTSATAGSAVPASVVCCT